jgi:hypothetical protein
MVWTVKKGFGLDSIYECQSKLNTVCWPLVTSLFGQDTKELQYTIQECAGQLLQSLI